MKSRRIKRRGLDQQKKREENKIKMDMNCYSFHLKLLKNIKFKEKGGRQKSEAKLTIRSCEREQLNMKLMSCHLIYSIVLCFVFCYEMLLSLAF